MKTTLKILKINDVIDKTTLSKSTIQRKMKTNTFPKPIKLSTRAMGWIEDDINGWIIDRVNNISRSYS